MAISRRFTVICDECTDASTGAWYKETAIADAIQDGWEVTASTGKALCPECLHDSFNQQP